MTYPALALKYRPQTFDDVVGQSHVLMFLRKFSQSRSLPSSLVFAGPRATGKTSLARILAAAMNCPSVDQDGNPCTKCPSCQEVRRGTSFDVLEIDAASNTGIDNIRNIKESLGYGTTAGWRIVLLDEAHSLSTSAFNALLKVLEEPPAGVSFILVTTEADKILDTIMSRSMYFEFRRHTTEQLINRLTYVNQQEGCGISDELVRELVVAGRGGLRDSLMLLDQVRAVDITTVEEFRENYGRPDYSLDLVEAIAARDLVAALAVVEEHHRRTGEAAALLQATAARLRDIVIVKAGGQLTGFDADVRRISVAATKVTGGQAKDLVRVVWETYARTGRGRDRAVFDMAVVQMAGVVGDPWETKAPEPVVAEPSPKLSLDDVVKGLGF